MSGRTRLIVSSVASALIIVGLFPAVTVASDAPGNSAEARAEHQRVVSHWTPHRRAAAVPRDLVIDEDGRGSMRHPDGTYSSHGARGNSVGSLRVEPLNNGKGGGNGGGGGGGNADTEAPAITEMEPAPGETIGAAHTFRAKVTDASGVKSVSFTIRYPSGSTQSFNATHVGNDVWAVSFSGFTDGAWEWRVTARDNASRGGNTATTDWSPFTVSTGGGTEPDPDPDPDPDLITNAQWTSGTVKTAAGRVYFEMPANPSKTRWQGYVCSGTVATDSVGGRSIVITAAHCVYDDAYKEFARNVLFIPDQAGTTASGTDRNCSNDPLGCWTPFAGVVDSRWATNSWPSNIPWDYAYYVFWDTGAHTPGLAGSSTSSALDVAAGSLPVQFSSPTSGAFTHAFGYSYSEDPKLMHCAEELGTESSYGSWWLSQCGLSGGASGGPWIQPFAASSGSGPIVSVNSWGYRNQPGMGGPPLHGNTASCLFGIAKATSGNVATTCS